MQDSGSINPNIAHFGQALTASVLRNDIIDPGLRDIPEAMRPGRNEEGRVQLCHLVEVDSSREHPFDQLEGRLHMLNAVLPVPVLETGLIRPLSHSDGAVLMPSERPI